MVLGQTQQGKPVFRCIASAVLIAFIGSMVITPRSFAATTVLNLPVPGTMVQLSPAFKPLMIHGLTLHPENPLMIDFIVGRGDSQLNGDAFKNETTRLIKYFLATLAIPDGDVWVNLSPYEKDRIVPNSLGQTELGRDMLAQDYVLKQMTASLIYPEKGLGKEFWNKVYAQAQAKFGSSEVPVNTFNKVWIVADEAKVHENKSTVFVIKSHLKVMLEEDYLALNKNTVIPAKAGIQNTAMDPRFRGDDKTHSIASQIVREVVLPALEKEVNTGKNFANLRQIYNSMILAVWFKTHIKEALLNQVYSNRSKLNGVDVADKDIKNKIYQQYLEAYKKGVFNYIKEDSVIASAAKQSNTIARKYFSGGLHRVENTQDATPEEVVNFDRAIAVSNDQLIIARTTTPSTTGSNNSITSGLSSGKKLLKDESMVSVPQMNSVADQILKNLDDPLLNPEEDGSPRTDIVLWNEHVGSRTIPSLQEEIVSKIAHVLTAEFPNWSVIRESDLILLRGEPGTTIFTAWAQKQNIIKLLKTLKPKFKNLTIVPLGEATKVWVNGKDKYTYTLNLGGATYKLSSTGFWLGDKQLISTSAQDVAVARSKKIVDEQGHLIATVEVADGGLSFKISNDGMLPLTINLRQLFTRQEVLAKFLSIVHVQMADNAPEYGIYGRGDVTVSAKDVREILQELGVSDIQGTEIIELTTALKNATRLVNGSYEEVTGEQFQDTVSLDLDQLITQNRKLGEVIADSAMDATKAVTSSDKALIADWKAIRVDSLVGAAPVTVKTEGFGNQTFGLTVIGDTLYINNDHATLKKHIGFYTQVYAYGPLVLMHATNSKDLEFNIIRLSKGKIYLQPVSLKKYLKYNQVGGFNILAQFIIDPNALESVPELRFEEGILHLAMKTITAGNLVTISHADINLGGLVLALESDSAATAFEPVETFQNGEKFLSSEVLVVLDEMSRRLDKPEHTGALSTHVLLLKNGYDFSRTTTSPRKVAIFKGIEGEDGFPELRISSYHDDATIDRSDIELFKTWIAAKKAEINSAIAAGNKIDASMTTSTEAKIAHAVEVSKKAIAEMMDADKRRDEDALNKALETLRVPLAGTKGAQPFLITIQGKKTSEKLDISNLTVEKIKSLLAPFMNITDQEAQQLLKKEVFTNFDTVEQSERNGLIYEAALKAGLLGTQVTVTNIKRFSPNSHLAYIQFLQRVAEEYNGHKVFVLSVEESPDVLKGDGAGMTTAMAAAEAVLGKEFMETADIDIITDGGLKERGGNWTGKYGYNGLMPTAYGVEYYRRAMLLLGKLRLQHKNYGQDRIFWTASDGDYDLGNVSYGQHRVTQLENDGSWDMMIHGAEEAIVPNDQKVMLFEQITRALIDTHWDNEENPGRYPLIAKALKVISRKKLDELGENFSDPVLGKMKLFQEKPTPKQILLMLKELDTNRIIPNAFLVVYTREAFARQQAAYMTVYDSQTQAALREVGGSYFQFLIDAQYNPKAIANLPEAIKSTVVNTLHHQMPKERMLAANLGSVGRFTDRGKTQFLSDAFWDDIAVEKAKGHSGLIKRGNVKIGKNVTIKIASGATAVLDNVIIETTDSAPIEIVLADNTFIQNSILRLNSGVTFQPNTAIVDSRITGTINAQGGNTVAIGVLLDKPVVELNAHGQWEKTSALQLFSGQTVVSILNRSGDRYLNRVITKAGYKGEPLSKALAFEGVSSEGLGITANVDANTTEWIAHKNWRSIVGTSVGIKAAKSDMDFVRTFEEIAAIGREVRSDLSSDNAHVVSLPETQVHMPVNDYRMGKGPLDTGIIKTKYDYKQVIKMLGQAKASGIILRIVGYLRGMDGAGSSLDLPLFQRLLTPIKRLLKWFDQLPSTVTLTSNQKTEITFELNDDEDAISYEAPDYLGEGKVYTVKGEVKLNEQGRLPKGQLEAPAYIFRNIFGLRGVKINLKGISPAALAGGMGSSGAFNVALITAASILSGANLSYADIVALAVKIENDELGGLTGGQEHWSTVLGGAQQLVWLSGIEGNNYGVASRELLSAEQIEKISEHVYIVQSGKVYENGKAKTDRTAALVNYMWTDELDMDPVGKELHGRKIALAARYAQALADGDFKTVVEVLNAYADIRDAIARRWMNLMLDAKQGKAGTPAFAHEYARKVFAPVGDEVKDYQVIRDLYQELVVRLKREDIFRKISFYSTDDIKEVVSKVEREGTNFNIDDNFRTRLRQAGGALFDAGAGGPGSNKIVVFPQGKAYAEAFFAQEGIGILTDDAARKIIRGTGVLRMYMPFKIGKAISVKGFDQLTDEDGVHLKLPQLPVKRTVVPADVGFQSDRVRPSIGAPDHDRAMVSIPEMQQVAEQMIENVDNPKLNPNENIDIILWNGMGPRDRTNSGDLWQEDVAFQFAKRLAVIFEHSSYKRKGKALIFNFPNDFYGKDKVVDVLDKWVEDPDKLKKDFTVIGPGEVVLVRTYGNKSYQFSLGGTRYKLSSLGLGGFIKEGKRSRVSYGEVIYDGRNRIIARVETRQVYNDTYFTITNESGAPLSIVLKEDKSMVTQREVDDNAESNRKIAALLGYTTPSPWQFDYTSPRTLDGVNRRVAPLAVPVLPSVGAVQLGVNGQPVRGGIDFNAINKKLQSEGDGVDIKFDPAAIEQFKRGNFTGVQIRITGFYPVPSLPMLLGLRKEDERLASI